MCGVDLSLFKDATKVSKNRNNQIKKCKYSNVSHASLVEKHKDEFKYPSRVPTNVLCVTVTNASISRLVRRVLD
jgi:hypothetical protein